MEILLGVAVCLLLILIAFRLTQIRDSLWEISRVMSEFKVELLNLREQVAVLSGGLRKLEEPLAEYLDAAVTEHYDDKKHPQDRKN